MLLSEINPLTNHFCLINSYWTFIKETIKQVIRDVEIEPESHDLKKPKKEKLFGVVSSEYQSSQIR